MILALDIAAMLSAFAAAGLWYQASRANLRRVRYDEILDAADINRIVVSFNRTQHINARAALATAISAFCVAIRFAATAFL